MVTVYTNIVVYLYFHYLWTLIDINCAVPENINTSPIEGQWQFQGGGGVAKAKGLKEKDGAKLEFPEGWGCKPKNPPWEAGYGYLVEAHIDN